MSSIKKMVEEIRGVYGLNSPQVLNIMLQVPREKFLPKGNRYLAYSDSAVPIGFGQTMSQPYTVAFMTDLLLTGVTPVRRKALEIGTGSGYQAAILSKLFRKVYSIEIIPELAERAKGVLKRLKYSNVYVKVGSGEKGWKEKAPFDAIMITAKVKKIPEELFKQLGGNGVLVAPVRKMDGAEMMRFRKLEDGKIKKEKFGTFYFVPFVRNGD